MTYLQKLQLYRDALGDSVANFNGCANTAEQIEASKVHSARYYDADKALGDYEGQCSIWFLDGMDRVAPRYVKVYHRGRFIGWAEGRTRPWSPPRPSIRAR